MIIALILLAMGCLMVIVADKIEQYLEVSTSEDEGFPSVLNAILGITGLVSVVAAAVILAIQFLNYFFSVA